MSNSTDRPARHLTGGELDARLIERWQPQDDRPEILERELLWHPAGAPAPLRVDLVSLFCSILG